MALSDTEAKELWKQLKDGKVLTNSKPNYTPDTEPVHKPGKLSNDEAMKLWGQLKNNGVDRDEIPEPPKPDDPSMRTATGEEIANSVYPEFVGNEATYFGEKGASAFGPPGKLGKSILGKIMDVLLKGQYASAELSKAYILGEEMSTENIIKHIKGKEKLSFGDVTPVVFPEWSPWKQKAAGFVLDIFGDPTTYAPAGLPRKAWKGVEKLPAVAKTVEKLGKTQLAKMFKPGAGLPKDFYELGYDAEKGLQAARHRILLEARDLAGGLSKKDMEDLSYYREHPDEMGKMSAALREKLDKIGTGLDDMVHKEVEAGLIDKETAEKWLSKDVPYLPHVYPNQRLNIVSGKLPPSLFEKSKGARFGKKRHISTIEDAEELSKQFGEIGDAKTVEEIDDLIGKYGLEDAFGIKRKTDGSGMSEVVSKPDPDIIRSNAKMLSRHYMPEKNAVKAYVIRKLEHENVLARDKFINSSLEQFGEKIPADTKVVEEGYGIYMPKGALRFYRQEVADPKLLDEIEQLLQRSDGDLIDVAELEKLDSKMVVGITKNVPKYKLPEEIARYMNQSNNFFMGDPQTHNFIRTFDKVQNVWKGMATAWRLPFHLRNMYSNMFQAYLSGVKNPKRFLTASDIQLSFITKHNDDIQLGEKVYKAGELRTMIEELGIHGKGWLAGDIQKPMMEELDSILRWGKMKKLNPAQLPREFGSVIEDNARIAVFVDQLAKGKTPKEAQQTVRKYLFDYTELTDFERNVMKRVIPFYTWSRKNIPLQIDSLINQPRKYQIYGKGMEALGEPETPEEAAMKPKYFDKMMYIKTGMESKKGKPVYMSIDLPPMEFNRMFDIQQWISSTTPAKVILEELYNVTSFPKVGNKIENVKGELTQAPFWVGYLPKIIRDKAEKDGLIDQMINKQTGDMVVGINKKWLYGIHTALPFLNEMSRMYSMPVTLDDERPEMKRRSYMTGIGWKTLDVDKEKVNRMREGDNRMRIIEAFKGQRGEMPTKRQLDILMNE